MEKNNKSKNQNKKNNQKKSTKQKPIKMRPIIKKLANLKLEKNKGYQEILLHPEHAFEAKVPRQFGTQTVPLHRHYSIQTNANALGVVGILFDPYFLHDNATAQSTLLIATNAAYDGTNAGAGTYATCIATPQLMPVGNVYGYRLVSSVMHILPQSSLTTSTGRIYASLALNTQTPGLVVGTNYSVPALNVSNITSQCISSESCISQLEAARICWLPFDIDSFEILNINQSFATDGSIHPGYVMAAVVMGATAGAPFTIEIYQNFEVTPAADSTLIGMETQCKSVEDPALVLAKLDRKSNLICGAFRSHADFSGNNLKIVEDAAAKMNLEAVLAAWKRQSGK